MQLTCRQTVADGHTGDGMLDVAWTDRKNLFLNQINSLVLPKMNSWRVGTDNGKKVRLKIKKITKRGICVMLQVGEEAGAANKVKSSLSCRENISPLTTAKCICLCYRMMSQEMVMKRKSRPTQKMRLVLQTR